MEKQLILGEYITILVNSCDAYEDLWTPFFKLLNRHWDTSGIRIVLNTETKDFSFEGMEIDCVHPPVRSDYGSRMLYALSQIKTKYVVSLLDDFFVRRPVDCYRIMNILQWMEADADIVYFNCDKNTVYADWEVNKYPGYRRYPPGNDYILSMQAAIWRTEGLKKYWHPNISPWEWEVLCNISTKNYPKDKFYTSLTSEDMFIDYGYNPLGMGVFRGKWVYQDIVPLFEKEGINVDYTQRGFYDPENVHFNIPRKHGRKNRYSQILNIFGWREIPRYFLHGQMCKISRLMGKPCNEDYFSYSSWKTQTLFLRKRDKGKV